MTNHYDTIIVGSGVSGMTAGITLAMEGENVLVVEQHKIPGGLMQTYSRKESVFPTGVHRIGSLKKKQPLWYYFKYLNILNHIEIVEMDTDVYESYLFPGQTFKIPSGHDAYKERLKEYFPKEADAIDRYIFDLKSVVSLIDFYNPSIISANNDALKYTMAFDHYLQTLKISNKLKAVLSANSPLYGLSSDLCPLLTHFLISDSYLNSSFRINEEKTPLSKAFANSFISQGGTIVVGSKVKSVIIEGRTAKGVLLEDKEKIFSNRVIFTGHPSRLLDVCDPEQFRPVYRKKLKNFDNTLGFLGVAMLWKSDSCPVKNSDAFIYDSWDSNMHYKQNNLLNRKHPSTVYLSALPAKKGKDLSVTALIGLSVSDSNRLFQYKKEDLNGKYTQVKQKLSQSVFNYLSAIWPDMKEDVEIIDTYTPVTFARYTGTPQGSAYGIKKTSENFIYNMLQSATRVKNMYIAGQSISFNGIHGALVSSISLCAEILGKKYLTNKIRNI